MNWPGGGSEEERDQEGNRAKPGDQKGGGHKSGAGPDNFKERPTLTAHLKRNVKGQKKSGGDPRAPGKKWT